MASREHVTAALRAHEGELRSRGVLALYLFGSVARGEDRPESDVDLFFDHRPGLGLEVIAIQERLQEIVPGKADATTRASLHPVLRQRIVDTAIRIF